MWMDFLWLPPPTPTAAPPVGHKSPPSSPELKEIRLQDNGEALRGHRCHRQSLTLSSGEEIEVPKLMVLSWPHFPQGAGSLGEGCGCGGRQGSTLSEVGLGAGGTPW